ncbi:MAG: hypothetical protein ABI856_06985 [Nitrospira sp.]
MSADLAMTIPAQGCRGVRFFQTGLAGDEERQFHMVPGGNVAVAQGQLRFGLLRVASVNATI